MINGKPRGKFVATRGLRQGDPLSLFLFIIVDYALSRMAHFCLERRILKGFVVGKKRVESLYYSILMSDDTLVFCPNEDSALKNWWDVLSLFLVGLGQSSNLVKTSLIGINLLKEDLLAWVEEFNCQAGDFFEETIIDVLSGI